VKDFARAVFLMNGAGSESTTQRVYHEMRTRIIQCDIAPGERLKVESLKEMLNAGATPIREALSLLTSDQLVERIDQRGFRAASVSESNFKEILMLRCQLDDIALRSSIRLGDTSWEENAVLTHHRLTKSTRSDLDKWESLHKEFHQSLLLACDSPILLRFCDQLYDLNIRYRFLAGKSAGYSSRDVADEHSEILVASIKRDAPLASQKLIEHYSLTGDYLQGQIA
jgi:GntR family carbon starvation induced transcriptional regulator